MPVFKKNFISETVKERETHNQALIEVRGRAADEHYSRFLKLAVRDALCVQQKSNPSSKMRISSIREHLLNLTRNKIAVSDIGDEVSKGKEWQN